MSTRIGARGEYLVCAAILGLSEPWKVIHAPQDSIDVVAFLDSWFLRVSVKSSNLKVEDDRPTVGYKFANDHGGKRLPPNPKDIDIVAQCFIDVGRVAFFSASSLQQKTYRRTCDFAQTPNLEQITWDKAVQDVQEQMK